MTNSLVNDTYLLYQCGTARPAGENDASNVFQIPLTSVSVPDTIPYAFLVSGRCDQTLRLDLGVTSHGFSWCSLLWVHCLHATSSTCTSGRSLLLLLYSSPYCLQTSGWLHSDTGFSRCNSPARAGNPGRRRPRFIGELVCGVAVRTAGARLWQVRLELWRKLAHWL